MDKRGFSIGLIFGLIFIVAVIIVVFVILGGKEDNGGISQFHLNQINVTLDGFSPRILTVNKGSEVQFFNADNSFHWIASAVHPTHENYPNSGIDKCGTNEESIIFDSCRALNEGETYAFVFDEIGEWAYHDHLNPSNTGIIIVQ